MNSTVEPLTLRGEGICLEHLTQDHAQGLYNRGRAAPDWAFMPEMPFSGTPSLKPSAEVKLRSSTEPAKAAELRAAIIAIRNPFM